MLTNDQVRAVLERIKCGWDLVSWWDGLMKHPNTGARAVPTLCLLAESQQALGEIQRTACIALVGETRVSMISKLDLINEIARNAVKGGSNGNDR